MYMVGHHVSFDDFYPLVLVQGSNYFLQIILVRIVYCLSSILWYYYYVLLT